MSWIDDWGLGLYDDEDDFIYEDANQYRDLCCMLKYVTDKALLVYYRGMEHWIPKSQTLNGNTFTDDDLNETIVLEVSHWILKTKGLIY